MRVLIVSPSSILRGALHELLKQVPGVTEIKETGSSLQVPRLLAERPAGLVIWDAVLEEGTGEMTRRASEDGAFQLVLIGARSPASVSLRAVTRMDKVDFTRFSQAQFQQSHLPVFRALVEAASETALSRTGSGTRASALVEMVVMGASTGGPGAVRTVISALPGDFPAGIVVVQHIDTGYDDGFASWLDENSALSVRLAADGDRAGPGEILVAPTDHHLVFSGERLVFDDGPKIHSQRPAVDRLFSSAAAVYGPGLVGILLTGIGRDGGAGCLDIVRRGGFTLVQDEATSTVYGMPKTAVELQAASAILPLSQIGPELLARACQGRR